MPDRRCEYCQQKLVRRGDEQLNHFRVRRFCNKSHANAATQGEKNRRRSRAVTRQHHQPNRPQCVAGWQLI